MRERGIRCKGRKAKDVTHSVVREEGCAGVGNHAEQGRCEAAEEVCQAGLGDALFHDCGGGGGEGVRGMVCSGRRVLVVNHLADASEGAPLVCAGFECQSHSYNFEGICEEDGDHAGETAADEAPPGGLLRLV